MMCVETPSNAAKLLPFFGTHKFLRENFQKNLYAQFLLTIFAGACTTALIPRVLAIYINNET